MEFNLSRIKHLMQKDFALNKTRIAYLLLVLFIVVLGGMIFSHVSMPHKTGLINVWMVTFVITLLLGGSIFTVLINKDLQNHDKAIHALGLPASHLEKLTVRLLYSLPFFTIAVSIIFYLLLTIYMLLYGDTFDNQELGTLKILKNGMMPYFISIYAILNSLFLMTSLYFKNYTFPKTMILGHVLFFILCFIVALFKYFKVSGQRLVDIFPETIWQVMVFIGEYIPYFLIFIPFCWVISYFLLKKKQV